MTKTGVSQQDSTVAVVTGAAGGIGAAVVRRLTDDGYRVAAIDRSAVAAPEGGASWQCDVADRDAVREVAAQIADALGPAGVLVNVAGVLRTASIVDQEQADISAMIEVNLRGVLHCLQEFAPQLRAHGAARVVTVASNAAGLPRMGMAVYGATKAAASLLTRSFGLEEARHGIRCNVVNPGSTDTPMLTGMWTDPVAGRAGIVEGSLGDYKLGIPAGRIADPADIADVVAFAVSEQSRHMWLQELYADGGATLLG